MSAAPNVLRGPRAALAGRLTTVVIFFVVAYGVAHGTLYEQSLVLTAAIFAILAVSLDLVAGVTGLYSLGHAGLFALGAYGTTILNADRGWNVFLLLPVVMVGTGLVGLILGSLSLRVSGLYFAITTFVFTLVVAVLAGNLEITGGLQGLPGPMFPELPDAMSALGSGMAWCVMLGLGLTLFLVWAIRRSALYPVLLAIRDAEPFAAAAGVRTNVIKVVMFGLSAALAGMAGWGFSFLGFVSPGQFGWTVSVNILVMVILGGINTTAGPIIGAAFVSMFPAYVHFSPLWQEVLFGLLFVIVIIFFPQGFVGLLRAGARRLIPERAAPEGARSDQAEMERPAEGAPGELEVPAAMAVATTPGRCHGHHHRAPDPFRLRRLRRGDRAERRPARGGRSGGGGTRAHPSTRGLPGTMTNTKNRVLEITSLSAGYGRYDVIKDVSLAVERGEAVALLGPNGAGKTTLLRAVMGLVKYRRGSVMVDGAEISGLPVRKIARGHAAIVPEGRRLFLNQSVEDNLRLGGLHLRGDAAVALRVCDRVYVLTEGRVATENESKDIDSERRSLLDAYLG